MPRSGNAEAGDGMRGLCAAHAIVEMLQPLVTATPLPLASLPQSSMSSWVIVA